MADVILRVQQQGYVRTTGYQATQWAVTVPIVVAGDSSPVGTTPLSYAPLFVVDRSGSREFLRRVASLRDYASLPIAELQYFEARGPNGDAFYLAVAPGDTLRVTPSVPHWLQAQAPYTDEDFTVSGLVTRASGLSPQVLTGQDLRLPGYTFGPEDVGRWVLLAGFATSAYNGYVQILNYTGDIAHVGRTHAGTETGTGWSFPHVQIVTDVGATSEPRFFPTQESNLGWRLCRGDPDLVAPLVTDASGGTTSRGTTQTLVRSRRFTHLAATLDEATALFNYVGAALEALQTEATTDGTSFTVLITRTAGP